MSSTGAESVFRDLLGSVVLLLVVRAAEPLFFGEGFYSTLSIHPYWIVVILGSVEGGVFVGIATAAAATMLVDWPPRPLGVDITAHYVERALVPVQWLLAAIIIGSFRRRHIKIEAALTTENERLSQMNDDFAGEIERLESEIVALELHLATHSEKTGGANSDARGR